MRPHAFPRSLVLVLVALCLPGSAAAGRRRAQPAVKAKQEKHDARGAIILNGERVEVRWTDGDSFTFVDGPRKGMGTRLMGYNSLEAYGPVHSWGRWTPAELYELAKLSAQVAAAQEWECSSTGKLDGYRRLLVKCLALAVEMARSGHGLAYAVEGEKPALEVLSAQAEAMKQQRGMWEKGTTHGVTTSLHSVDEEGSDGAQAYNRVVDTRSGLARARKHALRYETCQTVCEETDGQKSCMVYVPFRHRYRAKPACLLLQ